MSERIDQEVLEDLVRRPAKADLMGRKLLAFLVAERAIATDLCGDLEETGRHLTLALRDVAEANRNTRRAKTEASALAAKVSELVQELAQAGDELHAARQKGDDLKASAIETAEREAFPEVVVTDPDTISKAGEGS